MWNTCPTQPQPSFILARNHPSSSIRRGLSPFIKPKNDFNNTDHTEQKSTPITIPHPVKRLQQPTGRRNPVLPSETQWAISLHLLGKATESIVPPYRLPLILPSAFKSRRGRLPGVQDAHISLTETIWRSDACLLSSRSLA